MVLYNFRLRFNFPESYRIESDENKIELLVLDTGENIRLTSGAIGEAMKNSQIVHPFGQMYRESDL